MRDRWYADKRDIVKWGGIIHLLNDKRLWIKKVIQIAYYREDKWPDFNFKENKIKIPEKVLKHFRDIKLIKSLDSRIEVFDQIFEHKTRQQYTDDLCKRLSKMQNTKIVFLDPDTGLKPQGCKAAHVKCKEVAQIFDSLKPNDFLVFYQHRFRDSKWYESRRTQFKDACGVAEERIGTWSANDIANDVIFFFVKKG